MYINVDNNFQAVSSSWEEAEMNLGDILLFSGKTLLFFYGYASWEKCVQSLKNISNKMHKFAKEKVIVVGISCDKIHRIQALLEKQSLTLDMLSDRDELLYTELKIDLSDDRENVGILVDESGEVLQRWENVKSEWEIDDIVKEISKL